MILDGRSYRYDGLILPLSSDGQKIDALLVGWCTTRLILLEHACEIAAVK
jgi:hypothetical protein